VLGGLSDASEEGIALRDHPVDASGVGEKISGVWSDLRYGAGRAGGNVVLADDLLRYGNGARDLGGGGNGGDACAAQPANFLLFVAAEIEELIAVFPPAMAPQSLLTLGTAEPVRSK